MKYKCTHFIFHIYLHISTSHIQAYPYDTTTLKTISNFHSPHGDVPIYILFVVIVDIRATKMEKKTTSIDNRYTKWKIKRMKRKNKLYIKLMEKRWEIAIVCYLEISISNWIHSFMKLLVSLEARGPRRKERKLSYGILRMWVEWIIKDSKGIVYKWCPSWGGVNFGGDSGHSFTHF